MEGGGGGLGFGVMSKATARSGVMRVWVRGVSSSGAGSWSSQRENQLVWSSSSSLIPFF